MSSHSTGSASRSRRVRSSVCSGRMGPASRRRSRSSPRSSSPTTARRRSRGPMSSGAREGAEPDRGGWSAGRGRSRRHGSREPGAAGPPATESARQELRRRIDGLFESFGLAEVAGRMARTYSGGMQRKLDVAMGLVHRPRVLFLDEPTTGLDPEARAELWAEIARLADDGRADHPADDALPGGGRSPGESHRDRRPRRSSPAAPPTTSRRSCAGMPCSSSCETPRPAGRGGSAGRRGRPGGTEHRRSRTARQGRARGVGGAGRRLGPGARGRRRSPRSPSRDPRSTTSTCGIPAAHTGHSSRSPSHDRHRSVHVHDPAPHPHVAASAVVRGHHARAAHHLAAPVRHAVPQRDRDSRLRDHGVVPRLPGAWGRRHDSALQQWLEWHGPHRRHGAGPDGSLPGGSAPSVVSHRRSSRLRGPQPGSAGVDHRRVWPGCSVPASSQASAGSPSW